MSGGGGGTVPQGYQPQYQSQADTSYANLLQGAQGWGSQIPGAVIPGLAQNALNVQNNPYYPGAQQGAGDVANLGAGQIVPNMLGGNYNLSNLGAGAAGLAGPLAGQAYGLTGGLADLGNLANLSSQNAILRGQKVFNAGQQGYGETQGLVPSTTGGAQYALGAMGQAQGLAGLTSSAALAGIPGLTGGMGAADQVLNTAFDPQGALYDRSYQQMRDQTNAIASMYGVAGSPYGAGLASDASRNFNIDWQNNQLQRQTQGLSAYGAEQGQVASNLTGLLGSAAGNYSNLSGLGTNQYNALTSGAVGNLTNLVNTGVGAMNTGAGAYNAGMNTWLSGLNADLAARGAAQSGLTNTANIYGGLTGTAGSAYGQAGQQGIDALQTLLASSGAPSQTYLQQQQAQLAALQALASGSNAALTPDYNLMKAAGDYLGIGQNATGLAQNAVQANNARNDAAWSALGSAASTAAMFLI